MKTGTLFFFFLGWNLINPRLQLLLIQIPKLGPARTRSCSGLAMSRLCTKARAGSILGFAERLDICQGCIAEERGGSQAFAAVRRDDWQQRQTRRCLFLQQTA